MKEQSKTFEEDDQCAICLSIFYRPKKLPNCSHTFCQPCIEDTSIMTNANKCPLCRAVFDPLSVKTDEALWERLQKQYPQQFLDRDKLMKERKERVMVRLMIGNQTRQINTLESNKYEWTMFVQSAEGQTKLEDLVQKIELDLHPTFHPKTVVYNSVKGNRIQLKRIGWGTFRIGVKVFWKKIFAEPMTEFYHDLDFSPQVESLKTTYLHRAFK